MAHRGVLTFLAAIGALLGPGCRSWDDQRKEFVDPINRAIHREYPKAFRTGKVEEVLRSYGPQLAAREDFRAEKAWLLGRFEKVETAECVIEDLKLLDGEDRASAHLALRVQGIRAGGGRLSVSWKQEVECARGAEGFRIVEEKRSGERSLEGKEPRFAEESEARGLTFTHRSGGVADRWGRTQKYTPGSGLAVGDYDGDGHDDVYLVSGPESRLFRNKGDGTFEDVTGATGASKPPAGEGRCAVFGDWDGDGREDLFVGILDAPNLLLHNEGGRFVDRAVAAGLKPTLVTTGAAFADFDRDGFLDLCIADGGNLLRKDPDPPYAAINGAPSVLYRNRGDGTFVDRTREAGVGHTGWALTLAVQDYDLDGWDDIFLGNDVGLSVLYRSRRDGTFEDVSRAAGITRRGSGIGAAWGDVDSDGRPDLLIAGMASNSRWIIDLPAFPSPAPWYVNLLFRSRVKGIMKEMFDGNWYYRSREGGGFLETAGAAGIRSSGWAFGSVFLDYDNDGFGDYYIVNGLVSGADPADC